MNQPMRLGRRHAIAGAAAAAAAGFARPSRAANPLRIGIINDMNGPYSAVSGPGAVVAAKMAIADFGGTVLQRSVELLSADHLNKADTGLAIVKEWFGPGNVSMVADFANTSVALGVQPMLTQLNKIAMYTSVGTSILTGKACSPLSVHWAHDTYATTAPLIRAMLQQGKKTFFFMIADYTFGDILAGDALAAVKAGDGKIVGTVRHPLASSDFASYLIAAQASGADVVVLCNAGTDATNAYKQAIEFGLPAKQTFVTPLMFLSDVHSLGQAAAGGLQFTNSWYWDQNDETRAWAKRFKDTTGTIPNDAHVATYSAVLHYLRAIAKSGSDEAQTVMKAMHATEVNDVFAKKGKIRVDGKMVFDRYLFRAKTPSESKGEWDLLAAVRDIPAENGFRPLAESECAFIKT
ncbi:MAG: ABC transporter substrate-binding protein [Rhodospirillales bacterium]